VLPALHRSVLDQAADLDPTSTPTINAALIPKLTMATVQEGLLQRLGLARR
jgi:hypothetical protein